MHFGTYIQTSVTGYTRLDKIRSEVIKEELEISGIQGVRLNYKQNWIKHLERMDNTRLLKHALNYKPRGRRDRGRPRKRWQCVEAGAGQTTLSMEEEDDDDIQTMVVNLISSLFSLKTSTGHQIPEGGFFQILDIIMAANLHIIIFSSVTPYILVGECHRFGGPCCLHVQG